MVTRSRGNHDEIDDVPSVNDGNGGDTVNDNVNVAFVRITFDWHFSIDVN